MTSYLFTNEDRKKSEKKEEETVLNKNCFKNDVPMCYRNGFHPSRWEMVQVFLAGIWKPFKFKAILEHKNRIKPNLLVNDICPDSTLYDNQKGENVSLYQLMANQKPVVLICGSFT
ncbi:thyroxine 5'-deiodinase [Tieghemostelium lacteum]|uniref:Thyroxine 5'-deiodinase n=1 Tax=Tieghemostelium lacteum TaxID=361077 RepID=A0A151Z3E2_TIELA|nr:thyroxine 5'-deiodinase [Tieghemostelium lacteum]|eukprot:KYQ88437.1 thyroxine 5'-deiodinase [Tieghemostelium lacteum]